MLVNSVAFVYQAVRRQGGGACAEKAGGSGPEKTEQWQVFGYLSFGARKEKNGTFSRPPGQFIPKFQAVCQAVCQAIRGAAESVSYSNGYASTSEGV